MKKMFSQHFTPSDKPAASTHAKVNSQKNLVAESREDFYHAVAKMTLLRRIRRFEKNIK